MDLSETGIEEYTKKCAAGCSTSGDGVEAHLRPEIAVKPLVLIALAI